MPGLLLVPLQNSGHWREVGPNLRQEPRTREGEQDVVGTTATETRLGAQRRDQKGGEVDRGWPVVASSCFLHRASLFWAC